MLLRIIHGANVAQLARYPAVASLRNSTSTTLGKLTQFLRPVDPTTLNAMSKTAEPGKHCCCCRDHGHGPIPRNPDGKGFLQSPLPRTVKQSFPGSYNVRFHPVSTSLPEHLRHICRPEH